MDIALIVAQIDAEITKLEKARSLLADSAQPARRGPGRPKKSPVSSAPGRRVLSAEAKAKIASAQRKRWAKVRRAAREVPSKTTRKLPGLPKTGDVTLKRGSIRRAKAGE